MYLNRADSAMPINDGLQKKSKSCFFLRSSPVLVHELEDIQLIATARLMNFGASRRG